MQPADFQSSTSKSCKIRTKVNPPPHGVSEIPESKERRLRELFLLHHFQTATWKTLNRPAESYGSHDSFEIKLPRLAFKHNALLYVIYAITALHLAHGEPNEPNHEESYQDYLGLSLRLHRDDVATLCKANADAAMMTSIYLRTCTFALLQERQREPYSPPVEWLQMNISFGHGLAVSSWKYIADDPESLARAIIITVPGLDRSSPQLRDENVIFNFNENNRKNLNHLLRRTRDNEVSEPWGSDVQTAYTTTVSYIGAVQQAIASGEPEPTIFRRLLLFPAVIERSFIEVVREGKPRALVVLAHYFALLARFQEFWWVGKVGLNEVKAITKVIGEEWQDLMAWPLKIVEAESVLRETLLPSVEVGKDP